MAPLLRPSPRTQTHTLRVAVLASGRGSNLQALIDAQRDDRSPIKIVLVASDKAQAIALRRAEDAGIATLALNPKSYADRAAFDADLFARVAAHQPSLIVLAGFMRILDPVALVPWLGRIINIHPSLLPKYAGLHTHRRVLEAGDALHGASVHYVTAELDGGPPIAQTQIAVIAGDTPETLAERLLEKEHRLLVECIALIAANRIALGESGVTFDGHLLTSPLQLADNGHLV